MNIGGNNQRLRSDLRQEEAMTDDAKRLTEFLREKRKNMSNYIATIGFNTSWGTNKYYWSIEDRGKKISIDPYVDYLTKKSALCSLRRWIARLHLDCEIIDETG